MKRAGFTMIELIFVIVILGILGAVAIPKLQGVKDDAQLANANENFCMNAKTRLLTYAAMHDGNISGFDVKTIFTGDKLPAGWTENSNTKLISGTNLVALGTTTAATTIDKNKYFATNAASNVKVIFTEGNTSVPFGCWVADKNYDGTTTLDTALADSDNYL